MLDLKQLKYFVVSADTESFSEAATVLYTTQSNVSKSVKALEKQLGIQLFYREARGIRLTHMGHHIYEHATELLEAAESLESHVNAVEADWLSVSSNPSSWFAERIADFYNEHYDDDIHIRIQTGSTAEIMERIRHSKDELGFVYVSESDEEDINYHFSRQHLEFIPISEVDMHLFIGEKHPVFKKGKLTSEDVESLRFVQIYQDELTHSKSWTLQETGAIIDDMHTSVVTNSDYIMEAMLKKSPVANISATGFSKNKKIMEHAIPLKTSGGSLTYGYVKRAGEELTPMAQQLVDFIQEQH